MHIAVAGGFFFLVLFTSCTHYTFVRPGGPPAHAPAHGRRAKAAVYTYHYYPDLEIYWNPADRVWVVLRDGAWVTVAARPAAVTEAFGFVVLMPDAPAPWKQHQYYRGKYPPGHLKKNAGHHGNPKKNKFK